MTREQFLREIASLFDEPPEFLRRMRMRGFEGAEEREDVEIQRPRWRRIRWSGKALRLPTGKGLLAIFTDITEDSDIESDRKWQALTDEEFLVILADVSLEGARSFAERVRKAIELVRVDGIGEITISAGTAEIFPVRIQRKRWRAPMRISISRRRREGTG